MQSSGAKPTALRVAHAQSQDDLRLSGNHLLRCLSAAVPVPQNCCVVVPAPDLQIEEIALDDEYGYPSARAARAGERPQRLTYVEGEDLCVGRVATSQADSLPIVVVV